MQSRCFISIQDNYFLDNRFYKIKIKTLQITIYQVKKNEVVDFVRIIIVC